jgi:hypothetical protein
MIADIVARFDNLKDCAKRGRTASNNKTPTLGNKYRVNTTYTTYT